jgi:hypothetical protein
MLTRSAASDTNTSHRNGGSNLTSANKAASIAHHPWTGPILHGGVVSHGYLEVGQIPPWPVKQSPVYHLAAAGRYGIDTPVSAPAHLQPGTGYEPMTPIPLGIDNNERPPLSPDIRNVLRKYESIAIGRSGTDTPRISDALSVSEGRPTCSGSKDVAPHKRFPASTEAVSRKPGHKHKHAVAQQPENLSESQKKSKPALMVSDPQHVQLTMQDLGKSKRLQDTFELPYVGYKRRLRDMNAGLIQQDVEKMPVTPTGQIAIAKSKLPPKG